MRWEHLSPYSRSFNNGDDNFVAACQECNAIKYDNVFQTLDEAAKYVRKRRREKGLKNHPVWGNDKTRRALSERLLFDLFGDIQELKPTEEDTVEDLRNKLHTLRTTRSLFLKHCRARTTTNNN